MIHERKNWQTGLYQTLKHFLWGKNKKQKNKRVHRKQQNIAERKKHKLMQRHPMIMDWRLNIVNMLILSKVIYRFNTISIKIPMTIFTEIGKAIQKLICHFKWPQIEKRILEKKNKVEVCREPICLKMVNVTQPCMESWQERSGGQKPDPQTGFPVGTRLRKCIQTVMPCSC